MSGKTRIIVLHILGIFAFLSIPIITSPDLGMDMYKVRGFQHDFFYYVMLTVFFFVNYYYFMPKFYFTKRTLLYICFLFFSYMMVSGIPDMIFQMHNGMAPMQGDMGPPMGGRPMGSPPGPLFFIASYGGVFFKFVLVLSLSFIIKINNHLGEIHSEKLKAEVSYLKAQINPHFLFNTLNSLYALTIEKSDAAPDAVLKLSNMMRYVVTESTKDTVPLEKEIGYIKDYIDLQKLRVTDQANLEFSITGNPKGKSIAPLVAIPFIENAFKYGVNSEEDWKISVTIDITENIFTLDVYNKQVNVNLTDTTEQGIDNTQKRLDFIYPGTHELSITDNPDAYHVHLKIQLV
jgi:uncharacterized protein YlzI (FlbEa/FlbD family)